MLTLLIAVTVIAAIALVIAVITDRMPLMYVSACITTLSGISSLIVSHL